MITEPPSDNETSTFYGKPPGYHSYLLRFWEERSEQLPQAVWRFSLEDPVTDQRYGFATIQALMDWIEARIAATTTMNSDSA